MGPTATISGIVTDEESGERHIPESTRSDGSTRKAIRIRPGYRPAEDIELYRARNAVGMGERRRMVIPGAVAHSGERPVAPGAPSSSPLHPGSIANASTGSDDKKPSSTTTTPGALAASSKNAKRREARKKAKASERENTMAGENVAGADRGDVVKVGEADSSIDREKKVRNLKKKLKQAKDLKAKKDGGEGLLPEQIAKVIRISELARELEALGFEEDDKDTSGMNSKECRKSSEPS